MDPNLNDPGNGGNAVTHVDWDTDATLNLPTSAFFALNSLSLQSIPEFAFDGLFGTSYTSLDFQLDAENWATPGAYLGCDFGCGNEQRIVAISLHTRNQGTMPRIFHIDVSDDGVSWARLHTFNYTNYKYCYVEGEYCQIALPVDSYPTRPYRFFRLKIDNVFGPTTSGKPAINIEEAMFHPYKA